MKPSFLIFTPAPIRAVALRPQRRRALRRLASAGAAFAVLFTPLHAASKKKAPPAPGATPALKTLDYSGSQQALADLDREITAAGTDAAKLGAIAERLIGIARQTDTTFAARQAICQRLGAILMTAPGVGGPAMLNPFSAMLVSERDVDLARLALERVPGDAVDGLFLKALPKARGRARLAIVQSIGVRRIASAVPALVALLADTEPAASEAAAKALGEIGTLEAATALRNATPARRGPFVQAQFEAAARLPAADAVPRLQALRDDAALPVHVRATAFRRLLEAQPAGASPRIVEALGGSDWTLKEVAIEAISVQPAAEVVPALARGLANWDTPTQIAVLAALGRKADGGATAAVTAAARHRDPGVRRAALEALGRLPGTTETAKLLAQAATGGDSADAKIARQSLARLNGPGVSEIVIAGAQAGAPAVRAVYLEQLALRNMPEGVPLLLNSRADPDVTVRTAAVGALGEVATVAELPAVLDWAAAATDGDEQGRALRSVVNIALRNPNASERGRPIYQAIEQAAPDVARRLLPALSRVGGAESAECAARLAIRNDPTVAKAAVTLLSRWSDRTAVVPLVKITEKSGQPETRAAASDAALRYLEKNRETWSPELSDIAGRLLKTAATTDTRKRVLAFLDRGNDKAALSLASRLESDPELGARARETTEIINANRGGPPKLRASGAEDQVKNVADGKTDTRWSVPANGEEWVEADFRVSRPIRRLTLDQTARTTDFPERYEVYVTDDPRSPGAPRASGTGQRNRTVIDLPANTRGRYLLIKNVAERAENGWTISELYVD